MILNAEEAKTIIESEIGRYTVKSKNGETTLSQFCQIIADMNKVNFQRIKEKEKKSGKENNKIIEKEVKNKINESMNRENVSVTHMHSLKLKLLLEF